MDHPTGPLAQPRSQSGHNGCHGAVTTNSVQLGLLAPRIANGGLPSND